MRRCIVSHFLQEIGMTAPFRPGIATFAFALSLVVVPLSPLRALAAASSSAEFRA